MRKAIFPALHIGLAGGCRQHHRLPRALAGIEAGLAWAGAQCPGAIWAVTVPGDTPFIPDDLEEALAGGLRRVSRWAEMQGAAEVFFPPSEIGGRPVDPFFNINRPEDCAAAEALLWDERARP